MYKIIDILRSHKNGSTQKGGGKLREEILELIREENAYVWCIREELLCLRNKQIVCIGRKKLKVLVNVTLQHV